MSKLKKAPGELAKENFRREIRIRQGYYDLMTQRELAGSAGIPPSTLCKRLATPEDFTVEELQKLVVAIAPDPLVMLQLLGYSEKQIARLKKNAAQAESA